MKKAISKQTELFNKVIERIAKEELTYSDNLSMRMDLLAADSYVKLDFCKLLNSRKFDFAHDILGIAKNINRETFELDNCFVPRCAR